MGDASGGSANPAVPIMHGLSEVAAWRSRHRGRPLAVPKGSDAQKGLAMHAQA